MSDEQPTTAEPVVAEPPAIRTWVEPLGDRVLVRRFKEEERTKGGLIIPDAAKERPQRGEVVAVGPGRMLETGTRVPVNILPGDVVLFGKYSGSELKLDDEDLLLIREDEIVGIVRTGLYAGIVFKTELPL